jgi:hypothetical protein
LLLCFSHFTFQFGIFFNKLFICSFKHLHFCLIVNINRRYFPN